MQANMWHVLSGVYEQTSRIVASLKTERSLQLTMGSRVGETCGGKQGDA